MQTRSISQGTAYFLATIGILAALSGIGISFTQIQYAQTIALSGIISTGLGYALAQKVKSHNDGGSKWRDLRLSCYVIMVLGGFLSIGGIYFDTQQLAHSIAIGRAGFLTLFAALLL